MARYTKLLLTVMVLTCSLVGFAFTGSAAAAATSCDLYASPSGSDSASGQLSSPLATPAALEQALAPGQTGCLEAGSYGDMHSEMRFTNAGSASGQITITSAPGQTAKLIGLVEIEGSDITLSGLNIDGSNNLYDAQRSGTNCPFPVSNGLEIDGQHDIFENNNLYQSIPSLRGNGIGIGWNTPADNSIVRYNRIHDLGQCQAYDQMIYLAHGTGVQIYDNWMWNDAHGWGVQVYPGASHAHIYNNVIDHAGSGFVIGGSSQVSNNTIDHNIVMNSTGLTDAGLKGVGISTCCGMGSNNTFTDNDVYNNPGGIAAADGIGMRGNTTAAPDFVDAQGRDYRTTSNSAWHLWDGGLGSAGSLRAQAARVHAAKKAHAAKAHAARVHAARVALALKHKRVSSSH
jgi:hypothetical protein